MMKALCALVCVFLPTVFSGSIQTVDDDHVLDRGLEGSLRENSKAARFFGGIIYRSTSRLTHTEIVTVSDASICAAVNYACKRKRRSARTHRSADQVQIGEEADVLKTLDERVARILMQKAEDLQLDIRSIHSAEFIPQAEEEEERQERDIEEVPIIRDANKNFEEQPNQREGKFGNRITVIGTTWVTSTSTTTTTVGTVAITGAANQCPGQSITDHYPLCGKK